MEEGVRGGGGEGGQSMRIPVPLARGRAYMPGKDGWRRGGVREGEEGEGNQNVDNQSVGQFSSPPL